MVYKALMNGVDEVAVKLVKADKPTHKELTLFHKEVPRTPVCLDATVTATACMQLYATKWCSLAVSAGCLTPV